MHSATFYFTIFSIVFCVVLGTLLHFTFQWSNQNYFVALFSAVNESVWEHLKLVFFPMFLTTLIGYFFFKPTSQNFLCARLFGIIAALIFMTVFFYTYTGIIGNNFLVIDIASFLVAILIGESISYYQIISKANCSPILASVCLCLLLFSFILFTFYPPSLNIFRDSSNNSYGLPSEN